MNVRARQGRAAIQEIPSYEHLRLHGMSNLKVMRDGIRIARFIVRERFLERTRRTSRPDPSSVQEQESTSSFVPSETQEQIAAVDVTLP